MSKTLTATLLLCFLPSVSNAGWFGYDSYEDCMLGRMKGQTQMMYSAADKACKKEFGVEVEVYPPSNVKWFLEHQPGGVQVVIEKSDGYEVTGGDFIFSESLCSNAKDEEFGKPVTFKFVRSKAWAPTDKIFFCARAIQFKGKYK